MTNDQLAAKIVNRLLNEGLARSTWRDTHPEAYNELVEHRPEMIRDVLKFLDNERPQRRPRNRL